MKPKQISNTAFLCLLSVIVVAKTFAQTTPPVNIVTTAVPFLRISPDARAGGMGDVGIATSADANALFWNMAKIPFAEAKTGLSINYNPWLRDISKNTYLGSVSGYTKIDDDQALALSMRYFNRGEVQFTDFEGNELVKYQPREFAIDLGYSRKLSNKLAVGITLKYINSNLAAGSINGTDYKGGNAVAADISLFHNGIDVSGGGFSWGVNLSNLGGKIAYTNSVNDRDFLPANIGVGMAYTAVLDEVNKITLALDANKQLVPGLDYTADYAKDSASLINYKSFGVVDSWFKPNDSYTVSAGAEYAYNKQFFARAGYFYESELQGNRQYYTMGVGLKNKVATFNFSYLVPTGKNLVISPLANTFRWSVLFELSKASK